MAIPPKHQPPTITLTPKLRFPEFRDGPGWAIATLGDKGELLSSLSGKSAQHFGVGSAKYITYMNVFENTFTDMTSLGTVDVAPDESQNAVESGDILFTVSSETPGEVGMSSVVLETVPNCYLNSFCALFRFTDERPDPRFLGFSLRQSLAREHFSHRAQGSTRFNLSKASFRDLPLALPPPAEQRKIAACLTSLDELIAAEGRKLEALRNHKKGLMQQLFPREGETVPRLRFGEFRGASDWQQGHCRDVARVLPGYGFPEKFQGNANGEYPFYKVSDISQAVEKGQQAISDAKKLYRLRSAR